ncbi:phage tail assembly protein [Alkalilimnicola sp. S0819]|uniref:phage tail assembly protein n=1 Tax=Alkalilimnicola sp. S0819 TaxID=2613922 RepID=UPI001262973E|nr:phage tail assembly protein [Alkalilimnicola sp. S0819]KAB7624319.1 phage tail assembly protein [Alkalilimnicola sp. S0819]MPQ16144.1 hypothetical protein [Alkalilimnicola sp. S0819]
MAKEKQKTFTLTEPVDAHGKQITELTLRKPKAKQLKLLGEYANEVEAMYEMMAELADVPPSTIDELEVEDIEGMTAWLEGFFKRRRRTGKTS